MTDIEVRTKDEKNLSVYKDKLNLTYKLAETYSKSTMIPDKFKNNPADCVIALMMAERLNIDPTELMRGLYSVYGNMAFTSKFLIGLINRSNILRGRLAFRLTGEKGADTYGCYAVGIDRETGEMLQGSECTVLIAKQEGWWDKKGSKWPVMTQHMLQYRAANFWANQYAPDLTMGVQTQEELEDIEHDITSSTERVYDDDVHVEEKPAPKAGDAKAKREVPDQSPAMKALIQSLRQVSNADECEKFLNDKRILKLDIEERADILAMQRQALESFSGVVSEQ